MVTYIFKKKRNSIKGFRGILEETSNILQVNSLFNTRKRIERKRLIFCKEINVDTIQSIMIGLKTLSISP
jgi:hypothetical protein